MQQRLEQSAAIMIAIEHCGDVMPGQRCSAVFFSHEDVQRERAFYERFCRGNGMEDADEIASMVDDHVAVNPYWLVSIKPAEESESEEVQFHKVDDLTGRVLPDAH